MDRIISENQLHSDVLIEKVNITLNGAIYTTPDDPMLLKGAVAVLKTNHTVHV